MKNWLLGLMLIQLFSVVAHAVTIVGNGTEASYGCEGGRCLAQAPKSNLMQMCEAMKARAAWADDWQCTNTAIFDNGTSPQRILDLRKRPASSLTEEEKAILIAADKVGNVKFCDKFGGNGFVIEYKGRPAVITSAHFLVDFKTGKLKCTEAEMKKSTYFPNASYYNPDDLKENKDFYMKSVGLEYPPVNLKEVLAMDSPNNVNEDYVIFFLKEDITKDRMPTGNQRSFLKYSQNTQAKGNGLYFLGTGPDPKGKHLAMLYQRDCNFNRNDGYLSHDCATIGGSSGSLLGHMENGEIVFSGVHRFAPLGDSKLPGPSTDLESLWNIATPSQFVESR